MAPHRRATLKAVKEICRALEVRILSKGENDNRQRHEDMRRFKNFAHAEMHAVGGEHGFRFLRIGLGAQKVDGTPVSGPSASSM